MNAQLEGKSGAAGGTCGSAPSTSSINDCVRRAVIAYFEELEGYAPGEMYELVLSEVEPPLLEVVMQQARGNLTRAAAMLGLNRATLRKKLKKYGLER